MAKNRKASGSKKFVATLPYLVAPSDDRIDRMEIKFHQDEKLGLNVNFFDDEDRFLDWMMEIEDVEFDRMTDNYLCMKMQSQDRSLKQQATAFLDSMKWAEFEAWSWEVSPTKEVVYECMFIETYYATGDGQYSGYKPKSVEGYLAMASIDDRRALYASLGIAGYSSYGNYPYGGECWDMHSEDPSWGLYMDNQRNGSFPDQDSHAFDGQQFDFGSDDFPPEEDDSWDIHQSMRNYGESFCPEQILVREMPLRGLKYPARQALIREYCVA